MQIENQNSTKKNNYLNIDQKINSENNDGILILALKDIFNKIEKV